MPAHDDRYWNKEQETMKQDLSKEVSHHVKANSSISVAVEIIPPHTLPVAELKSKHVVDKRIGVWDDSKK